MSTLRAKTQKPTTGAAVAARGKRARVASTPKPAAKRPSVDIHFGDNLPILRGFPDASFDLVYIDPPFNTGKSQ